MKSLIVSFFVVVGLNASANDFLAETNEVKDLVSKSEIGKSFHYCREGLLTCRTVVLLKVKGDNSVRQDFLYDVFMSSERAVGSTGYFLKNSDGTFRVYGDSNFDGQIGIMRKTPENQQIRVTFDGQGLPTMHDMILKVVGTTKYQRTTMSYGVDSVTIRGKEYDSNDPNYSKPIDMTYYRINP